MNHRLLVALSLSVLVGAPVLAEAKEASQISSQIQRNQARQIEDGVRRSLEQRRTQESRREAWTFAPPPSREPAAARPLVPRRDER